MIDKILDKLGLIRQSKAAEIIEEELSKQIHKKYGEWMRLASQVATRLEKAKDSYIGTHQQHNLGTARGVAKKLADEFRELHKRTAKKGRK